MTLYILATLATWATRNNKFLIGRPGRLPRGAPQPLDGGKPNRWKGTYR